MTFDRMHKRSNLKNTQLCDAWLSLLINLVRSCAVCARAIDPTYILRKSTKFKKCTSDKKSFPIAINYLYIKLQQHAQKLTYPVKGSTTMP